MSVDLPDPDGPMIAAKRPAGNDTLDPRERIDRRLALAEARRRSCACTIDSRAVLGAPSSPIAQPVYGDTGPPRAVRRMS